MAALLAACRPSTLPPLWVGASGDRLPLFGDNPPIDPGLPIERGATLRVYQWHDYLYRDVLELFTRRHRDHQVEVRVESFTSMAEAIDRLRAPDADFDVFFPTIEALPQLVGDRLLRPLTHAYLGNLDNLWPFFRRPGGPFFDPGLRYSTPYTVYSTGIAWRRDLVRAADAPSSLTDPYDVYWDRRYAGRVGIYDSYREGLAMALLHRGLDVDTGDPSEIRTAADDLIAMGRSVGVSVSDDGAYEGLPTGALAVQQAWSGDVLSAKRFGYRGSGAEDLGYLWPPGGVVGCDLTAICSRGRNPVLAHAFLDLLLEEEAAVRNFAWNGYQPPLMAVTPEAFADRSSPLRSLAPPHLRTAILSPGDLDAGRFLRRLSPEVDATWRSQWQRFLSSI